MSCFASGCATVVLVRRLWTVIHTARRSGPQSWGGCALNPIHLPRCGISEQTAVYEQDGLGAVGHHTADSPHHRVLVARRVAVRTSPSPPWALYQAHTYQNDKEPGPQRRPANSFMLVLCAAPAHCPFLHLQLARPLCVIMYSTLPVSASLHPYNLTSH